MQWGDAMGKGGYHGGSTLLKPGSDWFSYRQPKAPETPEQIEERRRKKAEQKAKALASDPDAQRKAAEKAAQKAANKEAARQKRLEKEKLRQERAAKRKADPLYAATLEKRRQTQADRMASIVVEVKSKKLLNKPGHKT